MSATIDDKKLDGAGLATLWGIIKQYIVDNPSIPKATASVLGGIMVGTTLGVNNSGVLNLASGVVSAGTYKSVTVDTYGRVTAGSNPNTLAGYGITDAKISNGSIILGENSITPITSLSGYATQAWVQQQGYLTEETYKGTVTQVKVGATAYDPTSGVVSLPAYPTTLPASDVYSWAKAASKPSYTASEVGAATSGHTHTTSLASDSGTSTITLASAGKYKLTAGGTSVIFTMPTIPTVNYPVTSVNSKTGAVTLTASDVGAATSGHTHTTSLATSSGTNALTLAANTKYVLTAGGSTFIFTTPTDTNTWRPLGTGATDACAGNDSRLSDSRPASDVYSWAKASSKPTYTASEVGAATSNHTHGLSIATDSGTNQVTLAHGTKYKLTAGGSTLIFTMPSDNNNTYPKAVKNITRSGTTFTATCYDDTTFTFDQQDNNTWKAANTSQEGYAPKLALASTATIATQSTEYVLTYISGSETAPVWRKLPANAFKNDNTNTWRNVYIGGTSRVGTGTGTKAINFVAGSNVSISYEAAGTGSGQSGNANYFNVKIAATDTTYSAATQSAAGLMSAADKKKLDGIASGANAYSLPTASSSTLGGVKVGTTLSISSSVLNLATSGVTAGTYKRVTVDSYGRVTSGDNTDANDNTWRGIYVKGTSSIGTGTDTKALNFAAGSNVSISFAAAGTGSGQSGNANYGTITINATDTTYSAATQSAAGLMSAADKKKLDGIASGANAYSLPAASTSVLGGIKVNYTNSGKNYKVQLDSSNNAYVNVPWENTTYTIPTKVSQLTNDSGYITSYTNTWRNVYLAGTEKVGTGTGTKGLNFVAGSNVSITYEAAGTSSGQSGNANYFNIKIAATDTTYSAATQSAAGLMSAADKKKLDGIATGANAYSLPKASSSALGGIKVGASVSGKNYAVKLDSSNCAYVNVPWTDNNTTYTQASLGQVYAYSTPPTSGTAVTATNSDYVLATGGILAVQFDTNPVPASATLNVNSKGAKNIKYKKAALAAGVIKAGDLATFMYDGTQYELLTVDRTMKAVTDISRNGTTFTATCVDGSTFTFTQQDNNTTYTLAGLMGSSAKGGTTQPIYWDGSAFKNTTYTLGKSVPSDAKFTDTTYTFTNKGATLAWSTTSTIATVGGVDIKVTMPSNPIASISRPESGNWFNGTPYVSSGGVLDIGRYIDFHPTSGNTQDYTARIYCGETTAMRIFTLPESGGEIITSGNIGSQSVSYATTAGSSTDTTKLPLAGGTMSGHLKLGAPLYLFKNNEANNVAFEQIDNSVNTSAFKISMTYGFWNYVNLLFFSAGDNPYCGVGTTSPSYKLHVNGACAATSFPNTSDIRKKNIVKDNLSIGLNAIANAPLFDFTWKDVSLDKDLHIGSSAQYWKNVIPEAVTTAKDEIGTLSMQYDVIALASCISVAKETVTLKEKVALLETRVESLEKKIREYESN